MDHTTRIISLTAITVLLINAGQRTHAADEPSNAQLFDMVHQIVTNDFFDPQLRGVDWPAAGVGSALLPSTLPRAGAFADVVNEMLATLGTSHTHYFTPDDPKYYQLLGIFESSGAYEKEMESIRQSLPQGKIGYVGLGIDTLEMEQGVFVSAVFDAGPADQAGIVVGDRLVAVAGKPFHPIESFRSFEGQGVEITVQRHKNRPLQTITVTPRFLTTATLFVDAMQKSAQVIQAGDFTIGYIHVWSYSGEQYHDLLVDSLFGGELTKVDALLLDLRDGWGGASPSYLNLFNRQIPLLVMKRPRDRESIELDQQWRKPVALLINQRVRSGKEAFAYGFRKLKCGPIVGDRTAGAVVAGSIRFLPDNSFLYLAVADIEVDGERLEGRGVEPTKTIRRPIPFSQGNDPQFDAGMEALTRILKTAGHSGSEGPSQ